MKDWTRNIIPAHSTVKDTLSVLDAMGVTGNTLFIVDENQKLLGSVTDGDIRRGFLRNVAVDAEITKVMNRNCKWVLQGAMTTQLGNDFRKKGISFIPVVNEHSILLDVINLSRYKGIIAADAVIMAGGRGERLLPFTKDAPKPLLKVGEKPIIEYTIDRLIEYGIKNIYISINYLGQQLVDYFGDGSAKGINIKYIREEMPMGTIGSVSLVSSFSHEVILLMNSDLLTNIDFADFYENFLKAEVAMSVATVPHHVDMPYAIVEVDENKIISLKEKPRYTYFANAGIYLMRKKVLEYIPQNKVYNATDLMEDVLQHDDKLTNYPIMGYWLDIGKHEDFKKAQEDIRHINW